MEKKPNMTEGVNVLRKKCPGVLVYRYTSNPGVQMQELPNLSSPRTHTAMSDERSYQSGSTCWSRGQSFH